MQLIRLSVAFLVACSIFAALPSVVTAQVLPAKHFPMEVVDDRGFMEGIELRLRPDELSALATAGAISLTDVILPGGPAVDLDLKRARYDTTAMKIYRDGRYVGDATTLPEHSSWSGHVRGEDDSDVFLSFSTYGSRGWIKTQDRMVHLLASAGAGKDWSRSTSRFIDESALGAHGVRNLRDCASDRSRVGPRSKSPVQPGPSRELGELGLLPPLECTIAIETDFQLYQRFADETAELVYLDQLLGAASEQYVDQINTYLTVTYLGYHTTQNPLLPNPDRWDAPENSDVLELLYEFMNDWEQANVAGGPAPNPLNPRPAGAVGATLNHILSGASLGGGVAWLPGLCNSPYNYAASSHIAENLVPFPVTQGPLNWDFIVFTHETGHNFGSQHTHDFCPPLETCYTGDCNPTAVCMEGTIMGYCHLCPGGIGNVVPEFHQGCVDVMRPTAEACLPVYSDGSAYCFGDGIDPLVTAVCPCGNFGDPGHGCANSTGSLGGAELSSWGTVSPNTIVFAVTGVPNNTLCTFLRAAANAPAGVVFGDGVSCQSGTTLRFGQQLSGQDGNPTNTARAPAAAQSSGVTRYYQTQYRNPSAGFCPPALFNVSNGWTLTW